MNLATEAFKVAMSRLDQEKARPIVHQPGGVRAVKTIVVSCAIAEAFRFALNKKFLVLSGEDFYEMEDFISRSFGDYLAAAISKIPVGEVRASCDLSQFKPSDLIVIEGEEMEGKVELSLEQLLYRVFIEAIDSYMVTDRVSLDKLVVALDAVYDATLRTCFEADRTVAILRKGKDLGTK